MVKDKCDGTHLCSGCSQLRICFQSRIIIILYIENAVILSGQAQRLALARTLCHKKKLLILDDPFSALDKKTEEQIFANLKEMAKDCVVLLISHRLYLFPQMDQVIWLNEGQAVIGSHQEVRDQVEEYRRLYDGQKGENQNEK